MTVVCRKRRSPSLAGLCQHLPSAVSQQYLHVRGLLHSEGLFHLTECSVGACVFMCACRGTILTMLTLAHLCPNSIHSQLLVKMPKMIFLGCINNCIHHFAQNLNADKTQPLVGLS